VSRTTPAARAGVMRIRTLAPVPGASLARTFPYPIQMQSKGDRGLARHQSAVLRDRTLDS